MDYAYPVVHITVVRQHKAVVEYLKGNQLHLFDDGCCDSPGYSAKYATYSLMESTTDLILDYSLVLARLHIQRESVQCLYALYKYCVKL